MDTFTMVYYAIVCGGLALFVSTISNRIKRLAIGLVTGGISSALLPFLKSFM